VTVSLSAGACDICDGDTPTVGQSTRITTDDSIALRPAADAGCTDADNNCGDEKLLITCLVSTSFGKLSFRTVHIKMTSLC